MKAEPSSGLYIITQEKSELKLAFFLITQKVLIVLSFNISTKLT
ncbi:hypothetical protein PAUR_a0068 [Pseudoalteromonas aurantia 208]|uniref:Orphan protein n=1 Tax=Pseudoalteromonas aurantia 208 TaxID=1314867 RepID=A0ABR9E747_9GAMM|nr:hypothetical protein [Pseudoalteromonas aurantia 208]